MVVLLLYCYLCTHTLSYLSIVSISYLSIVSIYRISIVFTKARLDTPSSFYMHSLSHSLNSLFCFFLTSSLHHFITYYFPPFPFLYYTVYLYLLHSPRFLLSLFSIKYFTIAISLSFPSPFIISSYFSHLNYFTLLSPFLLLFIINYHYYFPRA